MRWVGGDASGELVEEGGRDDLRMRVSPLLKDQAGQDWVVGQRMCLRSWRGRSLWPQLTRVSHCEPHHYAYYY